MKLTSLPTGTKTESSLSRRHFIGGAASLVTGLALAPSVFGAPSILKHLNASRSYYKGVRLGVITYSFRSMPDQSAEATLQYVVDSGLGEIELMGDPAESFAGKPDNPVDRRAYFGLMRARRDGELTDDQKKEMAEMEAALKAYNAEVAAWRSSVSMDKFVQVRKMYADAGVKIYAFKPSAFGKDNSDAEISYGMRAAKALGATHVTLEHPSDDAHTARLGALGKKHKMYVAYHGHEQQTPDFWDTALEQSRYNALNLDLGHYIAAGNPDPQSLINAKHDRIMSMHVKDRQTPAHGKANLPWGTGDTPISDVLQLMSDRNYSFPATIELEYEIPEGSNAVKEVSKCLAYCREALS